MVWFANDYRKIVDIIILEICFPEVDKKRILLHVWPYFPAQL